MLLETPPVFVSEHHGGDVQSDPMGFLYVTIGDSQLNDNPEHVAADDPAQLLGNVLRLTDGGAPAPGTPCNGPGAASCNQAHGDNVTAPAGLRCREIFVMGLRNPFRIAFDENAREARFFIHDVGSDLYEEINEGSAGADYGWPTREGSCDRQTTAEGCRLPSGGLTDPIHAYDRAVGSTITGGAFVPDGWWPSSDGDYFFADFGSARIFRLSAALHEPLYR